MLIIIINVYNVYIFSPHLTLLLEIPFILSANVLIGSPCLFMTHYFISFKYPRAKSLFLLTGTAEGLSLIHF